MLSGLLLVSVTGVGMVPEADLLTAHVSSVGLIVYDKIISLYQGRPVSFKEQDMHVPYRFLDRYEELELWTPFAFGGSYRYPGSPARAISTFTALCSLSMVLVSASRQAKVIPDLC